MRSWVTWMTVWRVSTGSTLRTPGYRLWSLTFTSGFSDQPRRYRTTSGRPASYRLARLSLRGPILPASEGRALPEGVSSMPEPEHFALTGQECAELRAVYEVFRQAAGLPADADNFT